VDGADSTAPSTKSALVTEAEERRGGERRVEPTTCRCDAQVCAPERLGGGGRQREGARRAIRTVWCGPGAVPARDKLPISTELRAQYRPLEKDLEIHTNE
jgi:hypothetical protein